MSKTHDEVEEQVLLWRKRGLTVEEWTLAPGDSWSDRGHDGDEYLLVIDGQLGIEIEKGDSESERLELASGEQVFVRAGMSHRVTNAGKGPLTVYWAHAYPYDNNSKATEVA